MKTKFLISIFLLGLSCTAPKHIASTNQPDLSYSFNDSLAERSAQYLAYGQNAEICPDLSAKAKLILGYWITRKFRNTLNWQVTHNNEKGAYAIISGDELELIREVSIMNPIAVIDSCSYTQPIDSIGYLGEFASRYKRIGVGYAKIKYNTPINDSLMQFGDGWGVDVVLVLVK